MLSRWLIGLMVRSNPREVIMKGSEVKKIRSSIGLSQSKFCEDYGLNVFTVRQWERKDTVLDATASAYLTCIANNPDLVRTMLQHKPQQKTK